MNDVTPRKSMTRPPVAEAFEDILLAHVELCYSVAFALTANPGDARDLTRYVLTWAWHLRDTVDIEVGIKAKLLSTLRKTYMRDYRAAKTDVSAMPDWSAIFTWMPAGFRAEPHLAGLSGAAS